MNIRDYIVCYELNKNDDIVRYVCKKKYDENCLYLINVIFKEHLIYEYVQFVLELDNCKSFSDYIESFFDDKKLIVIFKYFGVGMTFEKIKAKQESSLEKINFIGQVMMKIVCSDIPLAFQCECLTENHILYDDTGNVEFYYPLDTLKTYKSISHIDVITTLHSFINDFSTIKVGFIIILKTFVGKYISSDFTAITKDTKIILLKKYLNEIFKYNNIFDAYINYKEVVINDRNDFECKITVDKSSNKTDIEQHLIGYIKTQQFLISKKIVIMFLLLIVILITVGD